ncbi:COG4223 family protein [Pannonibacter tanglangensis]|uniref:Inner membrane protein n=1 Tax=Pannonibacter tanglangensis TaxID=2750084 RepID=A0ABW9ZSA1_9HYPH|nr:hypothetical protein [Pannonibacter sp. XCT-34]NBN65912.1 hypothetical protein [Pannonibacter sp. XCT-34]
MPATGVSFAGAMAAALLVGVALIGTFYTLNQTGLLPLKAAAPAVSDDALADRVRLDTLERQLAEVAAQQASAATAPASGGDGALRDLEARLTAMVDSVRSDNQSRLTELTARLETVGAAPAAAPSTAQPAATDAAPGGEAVAQVATLQQGLQAVNSALASVQAAVSASDAALKSLSDGQVRDAEAVSRLADELAALTGRSETALADLRQATEALGQRLAAVEETMGDASAREMAARALSVSALRAAVDAGRPFVTELAAVKAALGEASAADMAALEANAARGIAPTAQLMAQFPPLARAIHATFAQTDPNASVLDNLLTSAASLVAVRGPGDASGEGPEAQLRRMEIAVKAGDLPAALEAYGQLPATAQAPAASWAEAARARVAVDRLTSDTASAVLSAIARKGN